MFESNNPENIAQAKLNNYNLINKYKNLGISKEKTFRNQITKQKHVPCCL